MFNRRGKSLYVALTASTLMTLGVAASAQAETPWEHSHPRRDQVNDRLEHQAQLAVKGDYFETGTKQTGQRKKT